MLDLNQNSNTKSSENQKNPAISLKIQVFDFLKSSGPAVPAEISQKVGRESYFVGAVLSELKQDKTIMLTHAKLGGSRIYYVPGQEEKLSILYKYLPEAEKKAYDVLKDKEIVKSSETTPVVRVALDNLLDFSKPFLLGGEKAWRWHLSSKPKPPEPKIKKPEIKQIKKPQIENRESQTTINETKPKQPTKEEQFSIEVERFFMAKGIKIIEKEVVRKNSESNFIINIDSQLGRMDMFVCAKNKKKINDQDLMVAHQKGQGRKMPTLFLSTGEQTKKAKEYLEKNLKGYMIYRKF